MGNETKSPWRWAAVFVALAVLVAVGAYAARTGLLRKPVERSAAWLEDAIGDTDAGPSGPAYVSRDFNYRFVFPGSDWQKDDALKVTVKANSLALARANPAGWMALAAKDFKTANPDLGRLTDEAVRRLSAYFENLEWELKGDATLSGRKARRLRFQGKVKDAVMSGECFLLAHNGVGYWFTTWTTAEAARAHQTQLAAEFDRLRKGFSLGHDRDGWKERQTARTFTGRRAAYELHNVGAPWKEWPDPQSEDEQADLLLMGADPDDANDIAKKATAVVLLLDKPADLAAAVTAARNYVEVQRKKTFQTTQAEVLADADGQVGTVAGHVVKLHVKDGEARERFLTLAVVRHDDLDRLIVIQSECDWKRRTRWEPAFQQLLKRFRLSNR